MANTVNEEVRVFEHEQYGKLRAVIIDDEPYFYAADVAKILGFKNPKRAIYKYVEEEDIRAFAIETEEGRNMILVIPAWAVYDLISSSKADNAKSFMYWFRDVVVHTLRKECAEMEYEFDDDDEYDDDEDDDDEDDELIPVELDMDERRALFDLMSNPIAFQDMIDHLKSDIRRHKVKGRILDEEDEDEDEPDADDMPRVCQNAKSRKRKPEIKLYRIKGKGLAPFLRQFLKGKID